MLVDENPPSDSLASRTLRTKTPDGRDLVFLSGTINLRFDGRPPQQASLRCVVGPVWRAIREGDVTATVSLAGIQNRGTAVNARWFVHDVSVELEGPANPFRKKIRLEFNVRVEDVDGELQALAYSVTAVGTLA